MSTEGYKLTKTDIAALRKGDSIAVHLTKNSPEGWVRVIKRAPLKSDKNPFPQDVEHVIPAHVTINGSWGRTPESILTGAAKCFALVNLYHSQRTPESNIVKTLRDGDEITFRFWPDAHSNGYVAQADLHADVLYLDVRRNGKTLHWELDHGVCPNNSARMCQGFVSEKYRRDQQQMREKGNLGWALVLSALAHIYSITNQHLRTSKDHDNLRNIRNPPRLCWHLCQIQQRID